MQENNLIESISKDNIENMLNILDISKNDLKNVQNEIEKTILDLQEDKKID